MEKTGKFKLIVLVAAILIMSAVPALTFSSKTKDLYVNADAGDHQDGSKKHPYETISQAIYKAKGRTDIHVSNGEYEENITIKKNVKIFGEDKKKTVIKAEKDKWATVTMKDDSEIDDFTIKNGKIGIWVESHDSAKIINCIVKDNDRDGIFIEKSDTKKSHEVLISKTEVKDNGWSGIFSNGPRRVIIMESEILYNNRDGVDLARGTSAWIAENSIRENKGSGLKLAIDGSDIWTKNNNIRENKREGLEVSFFGGAGRINIKKSKFVDNNFYGIARLQRAGGINYGLWNKYLTFEDKVEYWDNGKGSLSPVIGVK